MEYKVTFSPAATFGRDQFGFFNKGTVSIDSEQITLVGLKSWPGRVKVIVFLAITLLSGVVVQHTREYFEKLEAGHFHPPTESTTELVQPD